MDVARVAEPGCRVGGATTGVMPHVWPSSQVSSTAAGGRLGDRHMPGGRRPLGSANVGVTEDRGQDVWRMEERRICRSSLHANCEAEGVLFTLM